MTGFVAGTLVHTDKGLISIDQLNVGDMVLSRSENDPNAPNEYKRVLNTFESKEKIYIYYVSWQPPYSMDDGEEGNRVRYVFCSHDHLFWVKEYLYDEDENGNPLFNHVGWRPANMVDGGDSHILETYNGALVGVVNQVLGDGDRRIYGFEEEEQIAVASIHSDGGGTLFDFRQGRPIAIGGGGIFLRSLSSGFENLANCVEKITYPASDDIPEIQFYKSLNYTFEHYQDYVYNIQVEDHNTYFVGKDGIWVHQ